MGWGGSGGEGVDIKGLEMGWRGMVVFMRVCTKGLGGGGNRFMLYCSYL